VFNQESVADIAAKYAVKTNGNKVDMQEVFDKVYRDLKTKYPGHILPQSDLQWVFMNGGGWMGSMCILHASLTEYVLFFGSAMDTGGHSGRYWANITDTLLSGEFHQWLEGELKVHIHKPGETVLHTWGEATAVNFKAGTWMVEYGRGFIPSTLGFALADTIFSTQDFLTMYYMIRAYSKALVLEMGYYLAHPDQLIG